MLLDRLNALPATDYNVDAQELDAQLLTMSEQFQENMVALRRGIQDDQARNIANDLASINKEKAQLFFCTHVDDVVALHDGLATRLDRFDLKWSCQHWQRDIAYVQKLHDLGDARLVEVEERLRRSPY